MIKIEKQKSKISTNFLQEKKMKLKKFNSKLHKI